MMSDRSSHRVQRSGDIVPGQPPASTEFDPGRLASTARRGTYLTPSRLVAIEASLTSTDHHILETVLHFGFATGPQLAALHFGDDDSARRAARRALVRLRQHQLLDTLERRIGGVRAGSSGLVYRLGLAGIRLLTQSRRPLGEPGLHHLGHTLAIVDVRVELAMSERYGAVHVLRFDTEPACWRTFTGSYGEAVTLKPDAYVELKAEGRTRLWFLEVDRGTVSTTTLKTKLSRYRDYLDSGTEQAHGRGIFPRVVWATHTDRRRRHLGELCAAENARLGAELHRLIEDEWQPPPAPEPSTTNQPT